MNPSETVVYISGPLRADTAVKRQQNIELAEREAKIWWNRGYAVVCPHSNGRYLSDERPFIDKYLEADLELVRRSDIVVLLNEWYASIGASRERVEAFEHNKQLVLVNNRQGEEYRSEEWINNDN